MCFAGGFHFLTALKSSDQMKLLSSGPQQAAAAFASAAPVLKVSQFLCINWWPTHTFDRRGEKKKMRLTPEASYSAALWRPCLTVETVHHFPASSFLSAVIPLVQTAIASSQSAAGKSHKLPTGIRRRAEETATNFPRDKSWGRVWRRQTLLRSTYMLMSATERRAWKR